jgi:hypothetical protein
VRPPPIPIRLHRIEGGMFPTMTTRSHICITLAVVSLLIGSNAMEMPIPPDIKHIVTFVYVPDSSSGELIPNGTAFFVVVPSEQDPKKGNVYLVTAKHVLTADNTKQFYDHVYLRLNKKDRGVEFGKINLVETGPAQMSSHMTTPRLT